MTQHTVFGNGSPAYSLTVYSDGTPNIVLGNYFYPYASMATGWYCSGGRIYIPNDPTLFNVDVSIKMWKITTSPIDLSATPIAEATVTTSASAGWVEAAWDSVVINTGELVFIGYTFSSPLQANYLYAASPQSTFLRSVDDVDLALAEATIDITEPDTSRGQFRIGSGSTGSSAAWYGTDIIITDVPALPAPVAEYGFNETSGTIAADSSGNGHDITVNDPANFAVGRTGNGLHQLGSGDPNKITVAAPWYTSTERTMMFWARRGSEGANTWAKTVHQDDANASTVFGIFVNDGSNNVYFRVKVGGSDYNITTPEISIGTWAHYALTYDGTYVTAYIDGTQVNQLSAPGTIDPAENDNLMIYGDDYQMEVIDDLRLFNEALTQTDIQYYKDLTIDPPDTEPPSVPANLTGDAVDQAVTLDWDDSTDNVELQNYIVYRSDTSGFTPAPEHQVGGPAVSTYTETAPVGTWYYRVAARDEAGNVSAPSSEIEITTTAAAGFFFPSALGWSLGTPFVDDPQATGYNFGVLFAMSGPAEISGGRFYSPEAQTGLYVTLYANGVQVAQKTGLDAVAGWNMYLFDTPYSGTGGVDYIVAIYVPGPATSYQLLSPAPWSSDNSQLSVGPMYSTLSNSSRYTVGTGVPNVSSANWYGVDAVILNDTADGFDPTFGATIEEENAKPGAFSNEWAINGVGDTTNLGFARQFSVDAGETIDFSCHGTGVVLDIYRIGWYDGRGWRKVAELTNTATSQPDPNIIPDSNGGVECSNWSVTASWSVPADALSGLFVGVYRNVAEDDASYIPFLVRNDARTADMAYKTSDSTWALAYNYYGTPASPLTGKSVYGSGGPLGSIGTRTHAVSYHRPIVTREGVAQTYWLACEAPMIRFIERNGIDVKYVASRDVDAGVSVLANTNVALSSGHDEYWSDGMRDAFEAYRDSGGNIIFFSGNEVFWRTRFDAGRNMMWCYKDTMDGPAAHVGGTPLDPVGWTGTWKDTRFAERKPENTITGTDFRMNGVNDYSVTFSQSAATHPFWRDSSLSSGDITVAGIIGFEADEILPTQPVGSYEILANHNFNIDGKRADDNGQGYTGNGNLNWGVVSQRYDSGAVVVGFGTCQWAWGLDSTHDRGGNYVNASMQQATLNLFTDLGAAPTTVVSGLVAPTPVTSLDVYGLIPDSGRSGKVKVWDGADWNAHVVKVWDGGQWVAKKAKGYNGTDFVDGKG